MLLPTRGQILTNPCVSLISSIKSLQFVTKSHENDQNTRFIGPHNTFIVRNKSNAISYQQIAYEGGFRFVIRMQEQPHKKIVLKLKGNGEEKVGFT